MGKNIFKFIFSRAFAIGLFILLQFLIVVFFASQIKHYLPLIYAFFIAVSVILSLYLLSQNQEPSFKYSWIILLILFPTVSPIVYLIIGNKQMGHAFIKFNDPYLKKVKKSFENISNKPFSNFNQLEKLDPIAYRQARYITQMTSIPVFQNTSTKYLPTGDAYFKALVAELKKAKEFIFMEYFILTEGIMLNTVIDILKDKVKEGVDVRVIYDDLGCISVLRGGYDKYLESLGIGCVIFNKFHPTLTLLNNNRDHRKIVVIDGRIGITGGINLADEYINKISKHGYWKDTGILIEGDAVNAYTFAFLELWEFYKKKKNKKDKSLAHIDKFIKDPEEFKDVSDGYVIPFYDNPIDTESVSENTYLNIINQSANYLYIQTPYLVIDYKMYHALVNAARRGVDVQICTPNTPDKWSIHVLTQSFYFDLITRGVKIYEYTPGFIHSKTIISDDNIGIVGSINLDYRSFAHHFECGVWMYQSKAINQVKKDYFDFLKEGNCFLVTEEFCNHIKKSHKLASVIMKIFAPVM